MKPSATPLTALLSSGDDAVTSLCGRILQANGFDATIALSAESAAARCRRTRFDLAIYDQDCPGVLDLAGSRMPLSAPRVVIGLLAAAKMKEVAGKRIQFMVPKPFTGDVLSKAIRAAYGSIAWDRRVNFRHTVSIGTLSCSWNHHAETRSLPDATIVNVSRTGFCLQAAEMLPQSAAVRVRFPLPGGKIFEGSGSVVWAHGSGRAGVRFTDIASEQKQDLEAWLDSLLADSNHLVPPLEQADRRARASAMSRAANCCRASA